MEIFFPTTLFILKGVFSLLYRHKSYGAENWIEGPAIVAPNHLSNLDPPILAISTPEYLHYLGKKSLFKFPFGPLFRKARAYPIDFSATNFSSVKAATAILKKGNKLAIFPEGARSLSGTIQPFEPGMARLAYRLHVPIIPVYIHGTYTIWKTNQTIPKLWGRTACVIGKPIDISPFLKKDRKEAVEEINAEVKKQILALQKWYEEEIKR